MRIREHSLSMRAMRRLRKLKLDRKGMAATEFALLVPLMLVVFVGVTEVGQAIAISRKVTITVRTITDLVTQYTALSSSDMTNLLNAAAQVMAPYSASNVNVIVSEITIDGNSNAKIVWSTALSGSGYATGPITVPSAFLQPNTTLIWGQTSYTYTPVLGAGIIGATQLTDQLYMNPRLCSSGNASTAGTYITYGAATSSTAASSCSTIVTSSSSSGSGSSGSSGSGSGSSGSSGSGSSGSGSSGSGSSGSGSSGSGSSGGSYCWWFCGW